MFEILFKLPSIQLLLLLSISSIFVSVTVVLFSRNIIPEKTRTLNNTASASISQLISVIYGVLVGLTALYLINHISDTSTAVLQESNAVANIYRTSEWLHEPARSAFQVQVKQYLHKVIEIEWPMMQEGLNVHQDGATNFIDKMSQELKGYSRTNQADLLTSQEMIGEIKKLYNAREERIHMSFSALNPDIWMVVIIGTFLTIAINYLFSMNVRMHIIVVSAVSLMASAMIYLLITLDRPFQGEFVVEPDAFKELLAIVEQGSNTQHESTNHS